MLFVSGKVNQISIQLEGRDHIADSFFGLRRGFPDRQPDLLQNFLNLRWEAGDVFINILGGSLTGFHVLPFSFQCEFVTVQPLPSCQMAHRLYWPMKAIGKEVSYGRPQSRS